MSSVKSIVIQVQYHFTKLVQRILIYIIPVLHQIMNRTFWYTERHFVLWYAGVTKF